MLQHKRKRSQLKLISQVPRMTAVSLIAAGSLVLAACTMDQPIVVPDTGAPAVEEPTLQDNADVAADDVTEDEPLTTMIGDYGIANADDSQMLASNLLDQEVFTTNGDRFGAIEDLWIDASTGNILYAEIEHGGFLDIGDTHIRVPLNAMQWDATNLAPIVNMDAATLQNYPDLGDNWPNITTPGWNDSLTTFWSDQDVETWWTDNANLNTIVSTEDLVDQNWIWDAGEGNVDDLVIDLSQGRATYALIAADTGWFGDDNWRAIPLSAFDASLSDDGQLLLQPMFVQDQLTSAPAVDPNSFEDSTVFSADWDTDLDTYWGEAGFPATATMATDSGIDNTTATTGVASAENVMFFASDLDGINVASSTGEGLGELENVFIDLTNGQVLLATIEHGGFLDIGDEDLPVPLTALEWSAANNELILPISEAVLETFPDLPNDWDIDLSPSWSTITSYWGNNVNVDYLNDVDTTNVANVNDLVGFGWGINDNVAVDTGMGDAELGNINDMLVDMGTGSIPYVLVSFNDIGTYGEDFRILPYSAFDTSVFGDRLTLSEDFDLNLLTDAPTITSSGLANINALDPSWDDDIASFWEEVGYELGF